MSERSPKIQFTVPLALHRRLCRLRRASKVPASEIIRQCVERVLPEMEARAAEIYDMETDGIPDEARLSLRRAWEAEERGKDGR